MAFTKKQKAYIAEVLTSAYYPNPVPIPVGLQGETKAFIEALNRGNLNDASDATVRRFKQRQFVRYGRKIDDCALELIERWWGDYLAYYRSKETVSVTVELDGGNQYKLQVFIHAIPKVLRRIGVKFDEPSVEVAS